MPKDHTAARGECVSSIADRYGFAPHTIWNDPANAELKRRRVNPNMLVPGDSLTIPDKRSKEASKPTDAHHRFRRKGVPAKFRLQVFDREKPRANQDFTLVLDGRKLLAGTTDDQGVLSADIPPNVRQGKIEIGPDRYEIWINFGTLEPVNTLAGIQQRLTNLGYDCGRTDGEADDPTRRALRRFQKRFGLNVTGHPDQATRQKLEQLHDEVSEMPPEEPSRA